MNLKYIIFAKRQKILFALKTRALKFLSLKILKFKNIHASVIHLLQNIKKYVKLNIVKNLNRVRC